MKHKLYMFFLPLLIAALFLCGCNSYRTLGFVGSTAKDSISLSYAYLDGKRSYTANIPTDRAMTISVVTTAGELGVTVVEDGKEEIDAVYSGHIRENFSFVLNLTAGTYLILLTGKAHSGEFNCDWSEK